MAEVAYKPAVPTPRVDMKFVGKGKFEEYGAMAEFVAHAADHAIRARYIEVFGEKFARKVEMHRRPIPQVVMALEYYAQTQGALRVGTPMPLRLQERYEAAARFDTAALKRSSEFLVQDYRAKGEEMKKKRAAGEPIIDRRAKERRKARVTVASVLIPALGQAKVQEDREIIKLVREATGSGKFDAKQLAWYKWKFRQGKLKGQDGTKQAINQGSPLKSKAPAKKRRVVVKKKK